MSRLGLPSFERPAVVRTIIVRRGAIAIIIVEVLG